MTFVLPHNQIMLQLPDGRTVSIIQNGEGREGIAYGSAKLYTCEVSVEGEDDVRGFLTLRDVFQYLTELSNDWTLAEEFQDD